MEKDLDFVLIVKTENFSYNICSDGQKTWSPEHVVITFSTGKDSEKNKMFDEND